MVIYLDNNAAAPLRPEVKAAITSAMQIIGNPSAIHGGARTARAAIETARAEVAALVAVSPEAVTFTSSGTEANNLAIHSAAHTPGVTRLIASALEHACVHEAAAHSGLPVEVWPCRVDGVVDVDWLRQRLAAWTPADGRPWVALIVAQNETGVIQPVAEVAALLRAHDGLLHVDAVQAVGKIAVSLSDLGADSMAVASHKLGGPIGVGALISGPRAVVRKAIHGGGQERGMRAGGENLLGIVGFGTAAACALRDLPSMAGLAVARDGFEAAVRAAHPVQVFGAGQARLPNTSCVALAGFSGQAQVMALDLAGIQVGSGSACSSGKVKASQVLAAMGAGDLARCAIRLSSGWANGPDDFARAAQIWLTAAARIQPEAVLS